MNLKKIPVHLPRTVNIGIRKSGLLRKIFKAQMSHLPRTAGQPTADLPDALCLCQLTEQHGYKMRP